MKRLIVGLGLTALLAVPVVNTPVPIRAAAATTHKCGPDGYKHGKCVVVPASGTFTIAVPGTTVTLRGTGGPKTKGTQITVARVSISHPHHGASTIKVVGTGPMPALTPTRKGSAISRYNTSTGAWTKVRSIASPGIYEIAGS